MVNERLVFELDHWGARYMARRASEITDFYCLKCRKDFHGISMYEHFSKCSQEFFGILSHPKDARKRQEYFSKSDNGSVEIKRRLVEVDYVEQRRGSVSDAIGERPEVEKSLLLSLSGEDPEYHRKNISYINFSKDP